MKENPERDINGRGENKKATYDLYVAILSIISSSYSLQKL